MKVYEAYRKNEKKLSSFEQKRRLAQAPYKSLEFPIYLNASRIGLVR